MMMKTSVLKLCVLTVAIGLVSCAARRPVLYPNEHLQHVGQQVAERDIDDCIRRAEGHVSGSSKAEGASEVASSTVVGAGTGAAVGAVGGAITGNPGEGAAVGAATGGTAGLIHGLFGLFRPRGPDPVLASFVDRCLRERGYDPIGWQ